MRHLNIHLIYINIKFAIKQPIYHTQIRTINPPKNHVIKKYLILYYNIKKIYNNFLISLKNNNNNMEINSNNIINFIEIIPKFIINDN